MRKIGLAGVALVAISFTLTACGGSDSGDSTTKAKAAASMSASQPMAQAADKRGMFAGLNGKKVTGSAKLGASGVTLSGFSSDEGPDLHVYLTNGTDEAAVSAGRQLGAVKYDEKSQMFALKGVDASMYSTVVIHCDKAKAVFGAAKLS
ncbi:DM13 domain-containing protein [Streptomyces sp. NBC_00696]|uniref:DM13 domain-containing protein n=1 Tax=Streptomyces sp. NBC_00696 TaxID=2903672 RepID=UPI002E37D17F|nr:DM13 domain-containing protein [Streptomyces sp. NBC_00696]